MTDSLISGGGIKFCPRCGQQLQAAVKQCPSCGQNVGSGNKNTVVIIIVVLALGMFGLVVLMGIIAAIALPNFIGVQDKARNASVKANMRTAQIVAESYATDHNGLYPTEINGDFESYYPGGSNGGSSREPGTAGRAPVNPYDGKAEWPVIGHVKDVSASRQDVSAVLSEGEVEYSPIYTGKHQPTSYAIRGGGKGGRVIAGTSPDSAFVLSNQ
jgi:type II secretory pathway pseudopilin PulG